MLKLYTDNQDCINILEILDKNIDFKTAPENTSIRFCRILRHVEGFNYKFAAGATKAVYVCADKGFVIKIPFKYGEDYDCNSRPSYSCCCHNNSSKPTSPCYECSHCNRCEYELYDLTGADNSKNGWDYCRKEMEVYKEAEASNCGDYFAPTTLVGEIDNYPIYMQPIAAIYMECGSSSHYSPEYVSSQTRHFEELCEENNYDYSERLDEIWLIDFANYHGEEKLKKFLKFLTDEYITDLHDGNVGYIGAKPVLIDYSGYND